MHLNNRWRDWQYLLLGLLPFLFVAGILFLSDPLVHSDEALFVDEAKRWLEYGQLNTTLLGDAVFGLDKIAVWYPPLYFWILGGWVKLFRPEIEAVRYLSLLVATFAIITTYFLGKSIFTSRRLALLATLLVATDYFFGRSGRIGRMDILCFTFMSVGYFIIFQKKNLSLTRLFLAGVFMGMALFSHPIGLIGIITIVAMLFFYTKGWLIRISKIIVFGLPSVLPFTLWLVSLLPNWEIFIRQWGLQISRKSQLTTYVFSLWQSGQWFWPILFSVYAISFVLAIYFFMKEKSKIGFFLVFGFFVSTIMLLYGKEMYYPLYFQPFAALMLVWIYSKIRTYSPKLTVVSSGLVGIVFLVNFQLFSLTNQIYTGRNQNYYAYGQAIMNNLPKKGRIYLSALPDPYFVLQHQKELEFYEFPPLYTTDSQYYTMLDESDYVVYNQLFDPRLELYLKLNKKSIVVPKQSGNYDITLYRLKPKTQRHWPEK